jgi:hypothetical protein
MQPPLKSARAFMTRSDLEHVIRAAGSITKDSEIVVIGSQSVPGQFPNAPVALLASAEANVYPQNYPERAELIDRHIGEGSRFHETYGYYAQGVGEETALTKPERSLIEGRIKRDFTGRAARC